MPDTLPDWQRGQALAKILDEECKRWENFTRGIAGARADIGTLAQEAYAILAPIEAQRVDLVEKVASLEQRLQEVNDQVVKARRKAQETMQQLEAQLERDRQAKAKLWAELLQKHDAQVQRLTDEYQTAKRQQQTDLQVLKEEINAALKAHAATMQELEAHEKDVQMRVKAGEERLREFAALAKRGGVE